MSYRNLYLDQNSQSASTLSGFPNDLYYSMYDAFLPVQVRYNSLLTEDYFSLVQFVVFCSRLSLNPVPAIWLFSRIWGWMHYSHLKLAKISLCDRHNFSQLQTLTEYSCGKTVEKDQWAGVHAQFQKKIQMEAFVGNGLERLEHYFFVCGCNPSVMTPGWTKSSSENELCLKCQI